ncbi:hypothetical protein COOONC_03236 [Cooperia oncophora]
MIPFYLDRTGGPGSQSEAANTGGVKGSVAQCGHFQRETVHGEVARSRSKRGSLLCRAAVERTVMGTRIPSAYIFHGPNINVHDLPKRYPHQLMVFMLLEAPPYAGGAWKKVKTGMAFKESAAERRPVERYSNTKLIQMPVDYFNATMTYSSDSNYRLPYGRFVRRSAMDEEKSYFTESQAWELEPPSEDHERRTYLRTERMRIRKIKAILESETSNVDTALERYSSAADSLDASTPSLDEILEKVGSNIERAAATLDKGRVILTAVARLSGEAW